MEIRTEEIENAEPYFEDTIHETEDSETLTLEELPYSDSNCLHTGCSNKVIIEDKGDPMIHALYVITNKSDDYVGVTLRREWMYEYKLRFDTSRHRLYPGEYKEVFPFPRNQKPKCCIVSCNFEKRNT